MTSGGALVAAKVVFVAAGYAIYVGLSRLLSPAQFGTFLVVNSAVAVLNAVFLSGSIQTVSRFVSQRPENAPGTLRTALWLRLALSGSLGGAYFLGAPVLASALNEPALAPYLRVSAVIPVAYAFYAAMIGYANGLRRFGQQAAFDMGFSVAKVALVIGLAWLGFGALGAVAGFAGASVLILAASSLCIGHPALRDHASAGTPAVDMLKFEVAVMAHVGLTNLLTQLDLLMVQGLWSGGNATVAAAMYGSAVKLAQIPYSLLVALNFLIFPYIARSSARSSPVETAGYIRQALRLGAVLVVGPAVVLAAVAAGAVTLVFGERYAAAAPALQILALGYVAFALLTMSTTVINGAGRPVVSLGITAATVAAQAVLAGMLIPEGGIIGAAVASAVAYLMGLLAATGYLKARFGPIVPWASLARVAVAVSAVLVATSTVLAGVPALVGAPLLGALYLAVVLTLREWSWAELASAAGRTPSTP
jgi:O-antigen/teichoic acid export membrane protein